MSDPQRLAGILLDAERRRTPVIPLTRHYPFLDVETAYKAQAIVVEHRLLAGERVIGAKLGMTSAVKRHALGIDEPVHGRLTSGMVVPFGEPVRLDELIHPRAEPEIAFVLGRRIEGPTTVTAVLRATEAVLPAVEIVDSRYSAAFRVPDSVADNAGAARVAFGSRARPPGELADLSVMGCVFRSRRGLTTAAGGAAMGHPAAAVAWLAGALAARGEAIEEGAVVLTGGLTASVPLRTDGLVTAEFDGLGPLTVRAV
ncbi:MAG: 2-keto-4-pentenoate hydratase [Dehalococcoidia bacterium]